MNMPTITDWLMVFITAVYVGATILICIYNGKSAKASMKQVEESIGQFEANRRLQTMPFLQLELPIEKTSPLFEISLNNDVEEFIGCILRSTASADAFSVGRYAEHNGRLIHVTARSLVESQLCNAWLLVS